MGGRIRQTKIYARVAFSVLIFFMSAGVLASDNSISQSELKESIGLAEELRKQEHDLIELEIELLILAESLYQKPDYQLLQNIVHAISELEIICHYEAEILEYFDFIKGDISKLAFLVIKRNKMARISRMVMDNHHVKIISEIETRLKEKEALDLAKKANEIASQSIQSLKRVIDFYNRNASKSLRKY